MSLASQFYPTLRLRNFVMFFFFKKNSYKLFQKPFLKNPLYTCKEPLMMTNEKVRKRLGQF